MSSAFRKTNKYKESPYYSGAGYVEVRKGGNKLHDGKTSEENKLPKFGTHFSVISPLSNPSKQEASSNTWKAYFDQQANIEHPTEPAKDPSKVKKIVSGFERSLWGSKERKRSSIISSIILEEDPLNIEEQEADMGDAVASKLSRSTSVHDKRSAMAYQNFVNGSANANDAPQSTFIPLRSFDLNSTSMNPLPADVGDPPLPAVPPNPKLIHMPKENEYGGLPQISNDISTKHTKRSSSMGLETFQLLEDPLALTNGTDDMFHAQENHGVDTVLLLPPTGTHSLGWNKQSTKSIENQELKDLSSKEKPFPADRNKKSEEEEPRQANLKQEDSMDTLHSVGYGQMSFKSKDENTAIKITGTHKDEKVFLSGVASAFYNGGGLSLHGVLCCPSTGKINEFLDERRDELHAGVPGKWLTIVLGRDSSELSTIVATLVYAYFLSLTTREDQLCIVPLVNMVRADLALHPDVTWLLNSIGLHLSSLLFLDEINLSYFHRFGSLRLVLVNHTQLCPGQEGFKDDVEEILVVEEKVEKAYPHLKTVVSDKDVGSSCTLIAEEFTKHHPELLAGRALCRLLLAGILLDTTNLSSESTTRRDTSMATLLLNGAGKFGRNGLFKILKQKSHDLTNMSTNELLRKQFKMLSFGYSEEETQSQQGRRYEENVGMSSLPIPVNAVLGWEEDSTLAIADFPRCMALGLFVLVTGYYETQDIFKREILVVAKDEKLIESLSNFLLENKSVKCNSMPLEGVPFCMKEFSLEGKRISRTCVQNVLEDYFS